MCCGHRYGALHAATFCTRTTALGYSDYVDENGTAWLLRETWYVTTSGPVYDLARYAYVDGQLARVEYLKNNDPAQGYATAQVQFNWHGDAVMAIGPDGYGYTKPQTRIGPATFDPWGATAYGDDPPPWPNYGWNAAWGYLWFGDLGLYYVHGRWYSPDLGRFIEPDGNGSYIYYGDDGINHPRGAPPVNQSVPSECLGGNTNFDARDLTCWLYREIKHNLEDSRLQAVKRANRVGGASLQMGAILGTLGVIPALGDLLGPTAQGAQLLGAGAYGLGGVQFIGLVGDHAPWDFKHGITEFLGPGITLCSSSGCLSDVEFSVPGNIHFGLVAREAGYGSTATHVGAGMAEVLDPSHRKAPNDPDYTP